MGTPCAHYDNIRMRSQSVAQSRSFVVPLSPTMSKTAPGQEEEQSVDQQMYQSMSIYVDFVRREVAATFPDTRVKTRLSDGSYIRSRLVAHLPMFRAGPERYVNGTSITRSFGRQRFRPSAAGANGRLPQASEKTISVVAVVCALAWNV